MEVEVLVQVDFVADYSEYHSITGTVISGFFQPTSQIVEGTTTGDIVEEEGSDSASVVCPGDGAEGFLPGSVPHL